MFLFKSENHTYTPFRFGIYNFPGKELKKEFSGCAIGMELPQGHALRTDLDGMKKSIETLLDEFLDCYKK